MGSTERSLPKVHDMKLSTRRSRTKVCCSSGCICPRRQLFVLCAHVLPAMTQFVRDDKTTNHYEVSAVAACWNAAISVARRTNSLNSSGMEGVESIERPETLHMKPYLTTSSKMEVRDDPSHVQLKQALICCDRTTSTMIEQSEEEVALL
ncbi:unnamed protein product, partial [Timema podura]|nr:unnamed protein product [Timema podura]